MVRNIIFDLGGVIVTLDPDEALRRLKGLGMEDADRLLDPYTQTGIFGQVEEGKLSAGEFQAELGRMLGREVTFGECRHFWLGYRKELPRRNVDMLLRLRDMGYRLILLSNTNPFMMDWALSGEFDGRGGSLGDYFDALYLSYRLGVMKPSREFFRKVIEGEGIRPRESLFIDDGPRNVRAAEAMGFNTMCPENGSDWTGALLLELERLG